VQLVLAFLMSYPKNGMAQTDYGWESERKGYSTFWTSLLEKCYSEKHRVWHADVVRIVAPAIRNLAIMSESCNWQMERVRKHLKIRGNGLEEQRRCFDMLYKESQRTVVRLWAFTILERTVVMEVQTWWCALMQAVAKEHDYQMYSLLVVSLLSLIKDFLGFGCETLALLRTHQELMDQIQQLEQPPYEENKFTAPFEKFKACLLNLPGPGDLPAQEGILREARRAKVMIVGMCLGTLVLLLILIHASVKLVMVRYCEYGFWNLPLSLASFQREGCVDMSHIRSIMEARGKN